MKSFTNLTTEEKIEFFLRAQKILLEAHPNSPFLFTKDNVKERLSHARQLVNDYNGLCYMDDNIVLLFNRLMVTDPKDPITALKKQAWHPPAEPFNAMSIDFVVFRKLENCWGWVQQNYDPRIQYVVYVKNGTPQLFRTERLIAKVFNLPISLPQGL